MGAEGVEDGDGHGGVVGVWPGRGGKGAAGDGVQGFGVGEEEGFAEAVATGESLQGEKGALESCGIWHGGWMGGCGSVYGRDGGLSTSLCDEPHGYGRDDGGVWGT